jgi:DNA mismatch repair protein MutL
MPATRPVDALPEIKRLPSLVAAQIAAGEVVERPASVVKELVDNSIDAGATRITIELEQGGVELIRVSDDGFGIPAEQLPLAVAEHATSKIRDAADLDRITTMGFRGEALASIASVSRLSVRSRTHAQDSAAAIDVVGDTASAVRPESGPVGTSVSVRNLFFNTPARRKFVRTNATEQGHCADIVSSLAMSHPAIGFALLADGRSLVDVPPGQQPRDRVLALIGKEMSSEYVEAQADEFDDTRGVSIWGLVGLPSLARPTTRWQHLFLNGRPIRDKTVQHALKEAYRGLIEPGRQPAAVLMLEMDPGAVDVNVHPAKAEVRFRDSSMVHSTVFRAVRAALQGADLTPMVESIAEFRPSVGPPRPLVPQVTNSASRFVDFFRDTSPATPQSRFSYEELKRAADAFDASPQRADPEPQQLPRPIPASRVLQVHNSYLVTQDEHGVVIIDQHALHERVMFEKLKERIGNGTLESQRLLVPAVVNVAESAMDGLERIGPLLVKLGVEAEPIGPRAVAVHAFPSFLFDRKVDPAEFLGELLDRVEAEKWTLGEPGGEAGEAALHEVLDMMACKAAVKAGDSLSEEELRELVHLRESVERASNCPHGRPTTVRMTIRELEKLFGRS